MTIVHVSRDIEADPTGTALLLAGPAGFGLWPGLCEVSIGAHATTVTVEVPSAADGARRAEVLVSALPPERIATAVAGGSPLGIGFVTRFGVTGEGLPGITGELALREISGTKGHPGTRAEFSLELLPPAGPGPVIGVDQVAATLERAAGGFLDNLADRAEGRARAA